MFCRWAEENRDKLNEIRSSLEFKLHRLHFIDLLKRGPSHQSLALQYSRNFAPFAIRHTRGNNYKHYWVLFVCLSVFSFVCLFGCLFLCFAISLSISMYFCQFLHLLVDRISFFVIKEHFFLSVKKEIKRSFFKMT